MRLRWRRDTGAAPASPDGPWWRLLPLPTMRIAVRAAAAARTSSATASSDEGAVAAARAARAASISVPQRELAVAGARLDAAARGGDHLARVAQPLRVEEVAQPAHLGEVVLGEQPLHVADLLEADAVLAGEGSAHLHHQLEDLVAGGPHPVDHPRLALVIEHHRVQVAVASVEHVGDQHPVALGD